MVNFLSPYLYIAPYFGWSDSYESSVRRTGAMLGRWGWEDAVADTNPYSYDAMWRRFMGQSRFQTSGLWYPMPGNPFAPSQPSPSSSTPAAQGTAAPAKPAAATGASQAALQQMAQVIDAQQKQITELEARVAQQQQAMQRLVEALQGGGGLPTSGGPGPNGISEPNPGHQDHLQNLRRSAASRSRPSAQGNGRQRSEVPKTVDIGGVKHQVEPLPRDSISEELRQQLEEDGIDVNQGQFFQTDGGHFIWVDPSGQGHILSP